MVSAFAGTGKRGRDGDKRGYAGDGGPALDADFDCVACVAFNADYSKLYVTCISNVIRAIDMKTGVVSLAAGNGKQGVPKDGTDAKKAPLMYHPRAMAGDRKGNLYFLDNNVVRVVDPKGKIRTVAGNDKLAKPEESGHGGPALKASLHRTLKLCIDRDDNVVIAAYYAVLKYTPRDGKILRIAGTGKKGESGNGGEALAVSFDQVAAVRVDRDGTLYIVDSLNHRVFRLEK